MTNKNQLTGKQLRYLRGLGHNLKPFVMIGRHQITAEVIQATEEALNDHELIKVRIQENCLADRNEIAKSLSRETKSEIAQILGRTFLLYRASERQIIQLPS